MAITIQGITYQTVMQMTSRVAEISYANRLFGESDGRATELDSIFEAIEAATGFTEDDHRKTATQLVLGNMVYLAEHAAPVLPVEVELDVVRGNLTRELACN